jgi:hypothetical protein
MGEVAQLAEHATENRGVGSSILPLATTLRAARERARCICNKKAGAEAPAFRAWGSEPHHLALAALSFGAFKEPLDFIRTVAAVSAKRSYRRKLAGLRPSGDRLWVDPEKRRHLSRGEELVVLFALHRPSIQSHSSLLVGFPGDQ